MRRFRIGLISDTHGLLRPEAERYLRGADHILHAGDIGTPEVLSQLGRIAPVTAVRGNNDVAPWAQVLPLYAAPTLAGLSLRLVHEIAALDLPTIAAQTLEGRPVVVYGHSHRPEVHRAPLWCINPGSAGPRRFRLPVAAGEILIAEGTAQVHVVELGPGTPRVLYHASIGSFNPLI